MADGDIYEEAYGRVITDAGHPSYLGARVGSNNTGELTAWMEAAIWLLNTTSNCAPATVTFCYDSRWMASMVRGHWKPRKHRCMVLQARDLLAQLSQRTTVRWHWVKGHSGNVGNTRADRLAEKGKLSCKPCGGRHDLSVSIPCNLAPPPLSLSPAASPDELYDRLLHDIRSAQQFVPRGRHTPQKPWISDATLELIQKVRFLHRSNDPEYTATYRKAKRAARQDKQRWLRHQLLTSTAPCASRIWSVVRRFRQGFKERHTRLKVDGHAVPWSSTHKAFRDHLQSQQWNSLLPSLPLPTTSLAPAFPSSASAPFTPEELSEALGKLKQRRAPGPDGIRNEDLLILAEVDAERILTLMNAAWTTRSVPASWREATVVPIYKGIRVMQVTRTIIDLSPCLTPCTRSLPLCSINVCLLTLNLA